MIRSLKQGRIKFEPRIKLNNNIYTLFDGLAKEYARIFCELRSIFASPEGARKNKSNEQNRSYYMLNHEE